jgi:hypothetical protein
MRGLVTEFLKSQLTLQPAKDERRKSRRLVLLSSFFFTARKTMPSKTPIGLVTDSPCDLPLDLVERYNIQVVPAILVLDGQSYIDGQTISREEFYRRLPALRSAPSTAAPSPLEFSGRYERLLNGGSLFLTAGS